MATRKYSRLEKENLIREHAGVKTTIEIAALCGMTQASVYNYARAMKVSLVIKNPEEKNKPIKDFIRANYTTMTCSEAAAIIKITAQRMYWFAESIGLRFKTLQPPPKREPVSKNGMFNVRAKENWLV